MQCYPSGTTNTRSHDACSRSVQKFGRWDAGLVANDEFDVVVLGAGPPGENAAGRNVIPKGLTARHYCRGTLPLC